MSTQNARQSSSIYTLTVTNCAAFNCFRFYVHGMAVTGSLILLLTAFSQVK